MNLVLSVCFVPIADIYQYKIGFFNFFAVTQAPRTLIGIPGAIFGMSYTMYKMIGLTLVKINHGA